MATSANERVRAYEKRELRLEKMRNQIAAGELTVRQMTADERARWDADSAARERDATPKQLVRRDAALRQRARVAAMRRTRFDDAG